MTNNGAAQQTARDELFDEIKESAAESFMKQGNISFKKADELAIQKASSTLEELAALHDPDMIAGWA